MLCSLLFHPGNILVGRARIHHDAEPLFVHEIYDQVINHSAIFQQHAGIKRLARLGEFIHIVCQQIAQKTAYAITLEINHAHVRHVEHAAVVAYLMVFVDLRAVIDRHIPAAEIDHLCAHRAVGCIKRSLLE